MNDEPQPTNNDNGTARELGNTERVNSGNISPAIHGQVLPVEETPEQEEASAVEEIKKEYKLTPKFNKWVECFFDKSPDSKTYMNKTQSAIVAYNLDSVTEYGIAGSMGYQNFKKLQNVASRIGDEKGWTFEKFMQVGWLNALKSDKPEWWDRMGDMLGFRSMKPQVVVQQNTQNNTLIEVADGDKKSFNDQFKDFIKAS
jgi:hypothetical protein